MDDQDVVNGLSVVAIALMLAAAAWLLLSPRAGTSGGNEQLSASYGNVFGGTLDARHRPLGQVGRCGEAAAGLAGCVATSPAPTTPSGRRGQPPTRAAVVTSAVGRVPASSAPPSLPPATLQATTPAAPAPTRRPPSHAGPVPGGSTTPPHTGPSP